MKFMLMIMWNNGFPELSGLIYPEYGQLLFHARRIREIEGKNHSLFYLQWEEDRIETLKVSPFGAKELGEGE